VLDQSFSMSLPAGASATRTDLLVDALERRIVDQGDQERFALIAFEDAEQIRVVVPYPATAATILSAAHDLVPWGTSPILSATRFAATYAAGLLETAPGAAESAELILVTDGEDEAAYMANHGADTPPAPEIPPELAGGSMKLSLITLGGEHPGATNILPTWALDSGGEVIRLDQNGQRISQHSAGTPVGIHHEVSSNVTGLQGPNQPDPRSKFARVLAAWLLVLRWNLAVAAIVGIIVFVLALVRWSARSAAATRHNAVPTQVVLEVRTSLRRRSVTFSNFPITVGTNPDAMLPLNESRPDRAQAFELRLADEGLSFSATEKLNVNGVPRTSWQLHEGDQVRLGKYRVSFEALLTTTPLPPPPQSFWRAAILPVFSIIVAVALFVFQPLAIGPSTPGETGVPVAVGSTGDSPVPAPDALPSGESPDRSLSLPAVYRSGDSLPYFDADYLVIHAHPDDETLDYGVLLARLDAAGLNGVVVLLTDGQSGRDQYPRREAGGIYPSYDLAGDGLVAVRVAEARNAMGHLGVDAYIRGRLPNFPYNTITDQLSVSQVLDRWGGLWAIVDELAEVVIGYTPEIVISPDVPRGPYEHFEHEATGVIVAALLDSLRTTGLSSVQAHLLGIDPLQVYHYDNLVEISPWELSPAAGVSYRTIQMRALSEHKTQRDSSVVGLETRLAVPAEYYAVGYWNPGFTPPDRLGIGIQPGALSEMAIPAGW
jgi:LmbE family N-acetylglucosaminyl deacetylase